MTIEKNQEGEERSSRWRLEDVVLGVASIDTYVSCMKCNCKVLRDEEKPALGRCTKCGMLQCLDRCKEQVSAQILFEEGNGVLTLQAFTKMAMEIVQLTSVIEEALLTVPPFVYPAIFGETRDPDRFTRKAD